MSKTPPLPDDGLVEINDPNIDPAAIMAEIRARIRERRNTLGYDNIAFPSYGKVDFPRKPDDIPYNADLYYHLEMVNKLYSKVETESSLASSPATRLPVIGQLWGLIRTQAHNLVLYYVNRVVEHELQVNSHLISTINLMTIENQRQQREIAQLQDDIAALRRQN